MLARPVRLALAWLGPLLWIAAGLMPILGGAAKHNYRCEGREFTGSFDDCFTDYIPVLEMAALGAAVVTAFWFMKFSRRLFALDSPPGPAERYSFEGRLSAPFIVALTGCVWSVWRATTYPVVRELFPFLGFWLAFAAWFGLGAINCLMSDRHTDQLGR